MATSVISNDMYGKRPTLDNLPQEIQDVITKAVFKDTIVPLSRMGLSSSHSGNDTPGDVVAKRNGGLLLTCRALNNRHTREAYYRFSTFQSNGFLDVTLFLRTLTQENVVERKDITRIECSFSLDLPHERQGPEGLYFGQLFNMVSRHSKEMCVLVATQRLLDELALHICRSRYGVSPSSLRGSARFGGLKVEDLVAQEIDETS